MTKKKQIIIVLSVLFLVLGLLSLVASKKLITRYYDGRVAASHLQNVCVKYNDINLVPESWQTAVSAAVNNFNEAFKDNDNIQFTHTSNKGCATNTSHTLLLRFTNRTNFKRMCKAHLASNFGTPGREIIFNIEHDMFNKIQYPVALLQHEIMHTLGLRKHEPGISGAIFAPYKERILHAGQNPSAFTSRDIELLKNTIVSNQQFWEKPFALLTKSIGI